jgi:hypothetical protein
MSNAVEQALNRASVEQRERAQHTIEEARRNIQLVSVQRPEDITASKAATVAQQTQIIEEAKRNIPAETMKDVDTVSPPLPTPSTGTNYKSNVIELHPQTQAKIEQIEQGEGNNYQRENAVDRAAARQPQEPQTQDQKQQGLGR